MSESASAVAYEARNRANAAHEKIDSHEQLCAERYNNINENLSLLFRVLGWGGALFLTTLLGLLGFMGVRMIDSIDANNQRLQQQIEAVRER